MVREVVNTDAENGDSEVKKEKLTKRKTTESSKYMNTIHWEYAGLAGLVNRVWGLCRFQLPPKKYLILVNECKYCFGDRYRFYHPEMCRWSPEDRYCLTSTARLTGWWGQHLETNKIHSSVSNEARQTPTDFF